MQIIIEPPAPPEDRWTVRLVNVLGREVKLWVSETAVSALTQGTLHIQTFDTNEVEVQFPFQEVLP